MFGCPETERIDEIAKKVKKIEGELLLSSSCSESEIEIMGRKQSLNTVTPCAACKLLRRRCAEECPFSPYFSPHEPQKFAAVHKVFGASNVSKMLMEVGEGQRADAANSLVYEANLRLRDPVYGCMGAISGLQQQIQTLQAEVNAVRAEILKYKYREAAATATATLISMNHHHHHHLPSNNNNNQAPIIINNNNDNNAANSSSQQQGISQPPPLPPPLRPVPPNLSLPSPSTVVLSSSLSSSSASSVYNNTPPKTTLSHGSITSESVPYFA